MPASCSVAAARALQSAAHGTTMLQVACFDASCHIGHAAGRGALKAKPSFATSDLVVCSPSESRPGRPSRIAALASGIKSHPGNAWGCLRLQDLRDAGVIALSPDEAWDVLLLCFLKICHKGFG